MPSLLEPTQARAAFTGDWLLIFIITIFVYMYYLVRHGHPDGSGHPRRDQYPAFNYNTHLFGVDETTLVFNGHPTLPRAQFRAVPVLGRWRVSPAAQGLQI